MKRRLKILLFSQFIVLANLSGQNTMAELILINGKVITLDKHSTIAEAIAIAADKIIAVGKNEEVKKWSSSNTKIIDLKGKTVIPGLIDFHTHADAAALSELSDTIPDVHTISALLSWIKAQTIIKNNSEWIVHPKIFFTRLRELRQPSLAELDSIAPNHPVFLNGSYGGMINSAAMRASNITSQTSHPGIVRDKKTGLLTGFIRASSFKLLNLPDKKPLSDELRMKALQAMLSRYNHYGITSICSGGSDFKLFNLYRQLSKQNRLTTRIYQNIILNTGLNLATKELIDTLKSFQYKTGDGDAMVRVGAFKVTLDGGILTGTAFLREPWGKKAANLFGIDDTTYRGVVNYSRQDLFSIVKVANDLNWKFTAHCTGGGGVDLLLDIFEEVNKIKPIKERRFSIIHGNFYTAGAIRRMKALGIYADMQPAWFYKDADAMKSILGKKTIQTFHPYKSMSQAGVMINGGSDHMVKLDANTAVNPYNPFLAMWTMITRTTEHGTVIMQSEAISREQALRVYTMNNAYGSFEESSKGSLEPGKLADIAILTDDIFTCPVDQIKNLQSELTLLGGKVVFSSGKITAKVGN